MPELMFRKYGIIMANGAFFDRAKPENAETMNSIAREYDVYK